MARDVPTVCRCLRNGFDVVPQYLRAWISTRPDVVVCIWKESVCILMNLCQAFSRALPAACLQVLLETCEHASIAVSLVPAHCRCCWLMASLECLSHAWACPWLCSWSMLEHRKQVVSADPSLALPF